jgi:hypothetical protein
MGGESRIGISSAAKAACAENGILIVRGALSPEDLAPIRGRLDDTAIGQIALAQGERDVGREYPGCV